MEIHLRDDQVVYSFDAAVPPAASVPAETIVVFDTLDATGGFVKSRADLPRYVEVRRADRVNPATGPVWIEGAEPGDTITVSIQGIALKPPGHVRSFRGQDRIGVLSHRFPEGDASIVSLAGDRLRLDFGVAIPRRPMVGVIGVAPPSPAIGTLHPGDHGGNMDMKEVCPGATVHLPVLVPGAMLALGDVHASMGDGEVTGTGIEMGASVRTRLGLIKGKRWPRPWIELPEAWVSYGHASDLEGAVEMATSDMVDLLQEFLGLSGPEAYLLVSACGDVGIAQSCAGPIHRTARVVMPKLVHGPDPDGR